MDWKREAIEKLKEYQAKRQALESIPLEIARIESNMTSIRSGSATGDGTPVKGGGSGREDMLINNIVKREELEISQRIAGEWVARVERGLEALNDEDRLILDRFYIMPAKGNINRLCEELGVEQATVYRRRDKALRMFTIALYGCTES